MANGLDIRRAPDNYQTGSGRSALYAAIGKEKAEEAVRHQASIDAAVKARRIEDERKSGWSLGLSAIGGGLFGPIGLVAGTALGHYLGENASTILGQKESEKYLVDTDVGRFNLGQKAELEGMNLDLKSADRGDLARSWKDIGTSALSAFTLGGGSMKEPSNFSFTQFGGKSGGAGMGFFGKGEGGQSAWDIFRYGKAGLLPEYADIPTELSFDTKLFNRQGSSIFYE